MDTPALAVLLSAVTFVAAAVAADDDLATNANVRAALRSSLGAAARTIHVDSYGGTVQLSGTVDSGATRDHALRTATDVDGVNHVQSVLVHEPAAPAQSVEWDPRTDWQAATD